MSADNTSTFGTAFCESIDARDGVTTGISAADRARSIQVLLPPRPGPKTWCVRATRFHSAPAKAACWNAPAKPRPPSTWPAWPAATPAASSAKS